MNVEHVPAGAHSRWPMQLRSLAVLSYVRYLPEHVYDKVCNEIDLANWPRTPRDTWPRVVEDLRRCLPPDLRHFLPTDRSQIDSFGRHIRRLLHKQIQHGTVGDLPHPPRPVDPELEATLEEMFSILMEGWVSEDFVEGWHVYHSLQEADEICPRFSACLARLPTRSWPAIWRMLKKRHSSLAFLKIRLKAARWPEKSCNGAKRVLGEQHVPYPSAYTKNDCKFAADYKNKFYWCALGDFQSPFKFTVSNMRSLCAAVASSLPCLQQP